MSRQALQSDTAMLTLARRQHGVLSRVQLLRLGVGRDVIDRRLRAGLLRRLHRGVYCLGPIGSPRSREMAAVLACCGKGVISHFSAAGMREVVPPRLAQGPVDVITFAHHGRVAGIKPRRVRTLHADEVTSIEGIPVTTAVRTLLDLATVLDGRDLERAVAESLARRLTTAKAIERMLARHVRQPGSARLGHVIGSSTPAFTRSELEERFLRLIRLGGIAEPEVNVKVCGFEVDFHWRREKVVVEVDGTAFHASAHKIEADRRRDAALSAAGSQVMRLTWRQITERPETTLVQLAKTLALAGRAA
jgi:very-short-patch-repair endonuclease